MNNLQIGFIPIVQNHSVNDSEMSIAAMEMCVCDDCHGTDGCDSCDNCYDCDCDWE